MNANERFWKQQQELYQQQPYDRRIRYESWQPGRWAGNRSAIYLLKIFLTSVASSFEVGAGSAAFSFELHRQTGINISGIDVCENAKKYAERISADMGLPIDYQLGNLFDVENKADLVLSLGVIEHYQEQRQYQFLKKCRELSKRYVLVSIPNQNSPIFQNYVRWAGKDFQEYEEKHQPLTIKQLIKMFRDLNMEIIYTDGFQVFLSEVRFWNETDIGSIPLYQKLRSKFSRQNDRWQKFPWFDFCYEDIPLMVEIETGLSPEDRLENGFMTYVLAERRCKYD